MMTQLCNTTRDPARSPVSELTDDLLVEIISRLPFKSTCCCKSISTRWRDIVTHPDHGKKLPQTLAGFFNQNTKKDQRPSMHPGYQSISGNKYARIDTPLSFLEKFKTVQIFLSDCCNGLLLCQYLRSNDLKIVYVVCNPATCKSVAVPPTSWSESVWFACLAFDPAIYSHFHVFEFAPARVVDADVKGDAGWLTKGVKIYLSKVGAWTHTIVWDNSISIFSSSRGVFYSGQLYLPSHNDFFVAVVDMEGNCKVIGVPRPHSSRDVHSVYVSQGKLQLANNGASRLSIWTLEDSSSKNWILKHNVSHSQLLGAEYSMFAGYYTVISIHPESNMVFIVFNKDYRRPTKLMSYQLDSRKLRFICDISSGCMNPFLAYVPLLSESLADEN
ncbi:unnamed protein product [Alopecurus aequalis]